MVGKHHNFEVFLAVKSIENGGEDFLVNEFYALDFALYVLLMSALVSAFKVDKNEVVSVKKGDRCVCLPVKICGEIACCVGYFRGCHTCSYCDAFEQVNGRNHSAFDAIF